MSNTENRISYPSLHPDLVSYWPLEESSGTTLHDTSLYASDAVDWTADFGLMNVNWVYDPDLAGRLLFSKHYEETEDALGNDNRFMPGALTCISNCNYCGTESYCKACSSGMYLKSGACVSSDSDKGFAKDLLEREYKPVRNPTIPGLNGCDDPTCRKCSIISSECDAPPASGAETYCVSSAVFYSVPKACYGTCPAGAYRPSVTSKTCSSCTPHCLICATGACTICEATYLLTASNTCVQTNCGNGVVEDPEKCDDGNQIVGDGCGKYCLIEDDFTCVMLPPSGPSVCTPKCGDGKYYGLNGEECDDGNLVLGDGCDANCKIELNWWCENGSPTKPSECHCSPQNVASLDAFSADYMTLKFRFSRVLSVSDATTDLCALLFSNYTLLLGNTYSCAISGYNLVLTLGVGNKLYAGTKLPVTAGVIGAETASGCKERFSGTLTVPTIQNQVVYGEISLLSLVPSCEPLTIWIHRVTGGLNRPYADMALTVSSISGGRSEQITLANRESLNWLLSDLTEYNISTYFVTLEAGSLLPDVTYTLKLVLKNFQGMTYQTGATFSTTSGWMVVMNMEGVDSPGLVAVERSRGLLVRTVPDVYRCGIPYPNISDIGVTYTQKSTVDVLNITTITLVNTTADRILYIRNNTMKADVQYVFEVSCRLISTGMVLNTTTLIINSGASALQAVILPAGPFVVSENSMLEMIGSGSYDRKTWCG